MKQLAEEVFGCEDKHPKPHYYGNANLILSLGFKVELTTGASGPDAD